MDTLSNLPQLQEAYRTSFFDESGDASGRLAAQAYLESSTAIYHGHLIGLGFLPKVYDMRALKELDALAQTTYTILEKVTRHYLDDPSYRKLFGFSPELERLICLPTGYASLIPIMRMDLFLDEASMDFRFCEFNTDGSSAMNEDREGANALSLSPTFKNANLQLQLEAQELFDGWVDEFLAIYAGSEQAISASGGQAISAPDGQLLDAPGVQLLDAPCIAIVDYTESATPHEFEEFRRRFEARGYDCLICDIRNLEYRDGLLYGLDVDVHRAQLGRQRIDAVYRRAVTGEILADLSGHPVASSGLTQINIDAATAQNFINENDSAIIGAHALVKAVEQKRICMIGGFVSHVAHCKQLATVLHLPATAEFLSDEENAFIRQHLPFTTRLDEDHIDLSVVKENKDDWIVKPEDGYGSQGVYAGIDYDDVAWGELIEACSHKRYVVQAYCPQYATPNIRVIPLDDAKELLFASKGQPSASLQPKDPYGLQPWNILTGLYLYNGRFSGLFVRAGQRGIIVGFAGGITVPAFLSGYDEKAGLALRSRPV